MNPDRPLVGPSVDTFVGCFVEVLERLKTGKSALVGALVGAFVDPLVGRGSLSPVLWEREIHHVM